MPRKIQPLLQNQGGHFLRQQRDSEMDGAKMGGNVLGLGSLPFSVPFCSRS